MRKLQTNDGFALDLEIITRLLDREIVDCSRAWHCGIPGMDRAQHSRMVDDASELAARLKALDPENVIVGLRSLSGRIPFLPFRWPAWDAARFCPETGYKVTIPAPGKPAGLFVGADAPSLAFKQPFR